MMGERHYIFCLMGKSAAGKDTVYQKLRDLLGREGMPQLLPVVPYTTRPMRTGEVNGTSYYYETEEQYEAARALGMIIEARSYDTVHGVWRYYTKDDGQIDLDRHSYLVVGTLASFVSLKAYYGQERLIPLYLEVDDGERLQRALHRERKQEHPRYAEMCRRFLADQEDFSEERLCAAGVTMRFDNRDSDETAQRLLELIIGYAVSV